MNVATHGVLVAGPCHGEYHEPAAGMEDFNHPNPTELKYLDAVAWATLCDDTTLLAAPVCCCASTTDGSTDSDPTKRYESLRDGGPSCPLLEPCFFALSVLGRAWNAGTAGPFRSTLCVVDPIYPSSQVANQKGARLMSPEIQGARGQASRESGTAKQRTRSSRSNERTNDQKTQFCSLSPSVRVSIYPGILSGCARLAP